MNNEIRHVRNMIGNHSEKTVSLESYAKMFSAISPWLIHALIKEASFKPCVYSCKAALWFAFQPSTVAWDNFDPLQYLSKLLSEDPWLEFTSLCQQKKPYAVELVSILAFQGLNATTKRQTPAFIPFHSSKTTMDFITIRGSDGELDHPFSKFYSLFIDDVNIGHHRKFVDAFAKYIAVQEILDCVPDNKHIYEWFNKVLLHSNHAVAKKVPKLIGRVNKRIYTRIANNPDLNADDMIRTEVLQSPTYAASSGPPAKRTRCE